MSDLGRRSFLAILSLLVTHQALAGPPATLPRYEAHGISVSEYRSTLIGLLEDTERNQVQTPEREAMILKLVGSYRLRGLPNSSPIANESFIKVIVNQVLKKFPRPCAPEDFGERDRLRDQLRRGVGPAQDTSLQKRLDELERCSADVERTRIKETIEVPYPVLLDRALEAYLAFLQTPDDHSEAAELVRGFGKQLGPCLATRVMELGKAVVRAKEDPTAPQVKCELDETATIPEPEKGFKKYGTLIQLGFAKFVSCPLRLAIPDTCTLRKIIYNLGKAQLVQFRSDPKVVAFENEVFNKEVRKAFLAQLNTRALSYTDDLVAKFEGTPTELLTSRVPLIERNEGASEAFSLKDLADGLYADIAAATALHRSKDPLARGVAAALMYAAANRAVFLVGGKRAVLGASGWKIKGDFDPADPGKIPEIEQEDFGGIGVGLNKERQPQFMPWDLDNYSAASGGTVNVFPSLFSLSADGVPKLDPAAQPGPRGPYETLRDLGALLDALTYFLKVTGPNGEFAKYFVPENDFATLLGDRKSPALFPREGRAVIYGLAAAILQNLAASRVENLGSNERTVWTGHLEILSAGLGYHDLVSLDEGDPRRADPASTLGVARFLLAIKNFRSIIDPQHLDSEFPKSLISFLPQVDNALLFGHIQLAAQNPCQDGGFGGRVEGQCVGNAAGGGRTLQDSVAALRAITLIYNDIQQEAVLFKIRQAWRFMDQFWQGSGSALPLEVLGLSPQPVQPSRMWQLLALWNDTQVKVTSSSISREIPWDVWKRRFEALKARMLNQLQGPDGPEPLVP